MLGKPHIYLFSSTRLINSIKHEHSCTIIYVQNTTCMGKPIRMKMVKLLPYQTSVYIMNGLACPKTLLTV